MLLSARRGLVALCCLGMPLAAPYALAEDADDYTDDYTLASDMLLVNSLQIGFDAWDLHTSASQDTASNMNAVSRLQLANSYPQWQYRSPSPWLRFEGGTRWGRDTLLTIKFRADQSTGVQLDEASVDWAWNMFGLRAGVVDPKISWCRTYDVDAPWVREINPFCTIQPLHFAKSSAPGLQAYANFIAGGYSMQALVGLYRPLWLDYAVKESPTLGLTQPWRPTAHTKAGLALSATNLNNGTDFRLGWLTDKYDAYRPQTSNPPTTWDLQANVLFAGGNWYATRALALRGTYFLFDGHMDRAYLGPGYGKTQHDDRVYTATTLELNYQINARDVFALSRSRYDYVIDSQYYKQVQGVTMPGRFAAGNPHFITTSSSMSWRRDWGRGVFTVLQYSVSGTDQTDSNPPMATSSDGHGLGLRLGYRF